MQITIEDISPVEKRVEFELPWTDVAPRLDKAYAELRREVRLRGFRPGKAPRQILERLYGRDVESDVARELIEVSLGQAINERQIEPVAPPTIDRMELKRGEPFRFSARVEVRSPVVPRDYVGIALKRRPPKVTEPEVAEALEGYRRRLTELRPIEGRTETAASDVVVAELHGEVGAEHVHRTGKEATVIDLGDERAGPLPGLVERLRGLPIATKGHRLAYTIPDDAQPAELAGKPVKLEVTLRDVREKRVPELDDDLAKDTGEAETLDGLRAKVREKLLEVDRQRIRRELEQALVKELVAKNEFPVAPGLVDRHASLIVNRAKAQLLMAGIDVSAGGLNEQKMKQDFHDEALEEARATILLQAIAEREGITATDADMQKRLAEIAAARQENVKKLRAESARDGRIRALRHQIIEQKTLDALVSQAKIADQDPDRLIVTPEEARAEEAERRRRSRSGGEKDESET